MTGPIEKIVHHRTLFQYVPRSVLRALHPVLRRLYFTEYVLPEHAEVHTLVHYLPGHPVTHSHAVGSVTILAPAEKFTIADPQQDPFVSKAKYYRDGTFVRPPILTCRLPEARLHIGTGMVCTRDWEIVPDMEYRMTDYPEIRKHRPRNLHRLSGTYSTIFSWNGENFGHWMFDFLPRIHVLAKAEPETNITLLMPDFLRPALRESMESVLPPTITVAYHPRDAWVEAENFIWASVVSGRCNFFLPREYFEAIRQPIFKRFGLPPKHRKTKRIFVTRRHATTRRILNEPEVSILLTRYGFESVELGDLSFREQVELFHQADIVVGPHGAGLSSIVFSGDIKLVVLYATQTPLNHWHTLALGLGQEHYFVLHNAGEDDSFAVDLKELEHVLRDRVGLQPA